MSKLPLPSNLPLRVRGIKGVISIIFITPLTPLILRGGLWKMFLRGEFFEKID